ncbi:TPA_asm: MC052R [Molluscum contagiosum virus]|uniref:MC052R n=2 Tax=Molluscum contagiosum virus TaxID=10279 RepID=A0A7G5AX52_MCV1|nr:MC052 [Molluscum contagiosum virus subtype 1]QHW17857.1 MC052R [Molluscum contagiosum virus]AQY16979.1 MC052 [Molluscum contagiosum virus subtype 1]AQY17159.1 MC052 [Molluscum contagiosum virus subtype 1]AYO87511.1 MC052 [Molluscum contagiosum virus subtype 1]
MFGLYLRSGITCCHIETGACVSRARMHACRRLCLVCTCEEDASTRLVSQQQEDARVRFSYKKGHLRGELHELCACRMPMPDLAPEVGQDNRLFLHVLAVG